MDESTQTKLYKLPILPAVPGPAMQGKVISQAMIDSALAYNPKFRPSYVYLNETHAHNAAGKANGEVLASIVRTYKENDHVIAEVLPQRKYRDGKFEELAFADGSHPGRSIDLWNKKLIPDCPSEFYLEGIALCGAQKPATVNLPAIYYSTETEYGTLTFSINTISSLTGGTMSEEKTDKVDLASFQKQIDELKSQFATEKQTLVAERDHYKEENKQLATRLSDVEGKLMLQEIEKVFNEDLKGKIKSDERKRRIEFAVTLKKESEERYNDYIDSLKARTVIVSLAVVAGGVSSQMGADEAPQDAISAIRTFASENNLNIGKGEDLRKAEVGARQKWPTAFGIREAK